MSKIDDTQEFCIGEPGSNFKPTKCTDVSGGIRFEFSMFHNLPMRFNKKGKTICLNYHPDYLQNLATSLGYSTYVVNRTRSGNACTLVWLDANGNFQSASGDSSLELPFDVTFSRDVSNTTGKVDIRCCTKTT